MGYSAENLQLRSLLKPSGDIELTLEACALRDLQEDEILVKMEAAPINPSDLSLMFGQWSAVKVRSGKNGAQRTLETTAPPQALHFLSRRINLSLPVGIEGAGLVVAAGGALRAEALMGKRVAILGRGTYARFCIVKAASALMLPDNASSQDGASSFVNPLTALGMVETMRREDHSALIHTAAASSVGRMLIRICQDDGVPLVNIVRSDEQAKSLKDMGATHVVDSSTQTFVRDLVEAVRETNATVAFDAIGGGPLAGQIIDAMERVASESEPDFNNYGSPTPKQIYVYGSLDSSPTVINRTFGFTWGVSGWLLTPFLARIGPDAADRLRNRVRAELTSTFRNTYSAEISLEDMLDPDIVSAVLKTSTGKKYLVRPEAVT
jgi:NADPH2:quinone reductase